MHGYVMGLSCKPNIYVYCSTSELRVRLVLWNRFKPSSKYFYWPFQGGTSFVDHLCHLCLVFVMLSRLFSSALWSPVGKGLTYWFLFVMSNCDFVTFPCGIQGQVWYLVLLYTYNWYDFRTVCFLAIWYRKPDQRTEVFWIHITIL